MTATTKKMPIIFIGHGGGPLPLLNDPNHQQLTQFLSNIGSQWSKPKAILMISAHWEEQLATVTSSPAPELIYDYYGFPKESYSIEYSAPGDPELAQRIMTLLGEHGVKTSSDQQRGFDHGTFVPLKLIYPNAEIPVVQLSLISTLDPQVHIDIGEAISSLAQQGVLVIGSGLSFHNLKVLIRQSPDTMKKSHVFDQWLNQVLLDDSLSWADRRQQLLHWTNAPYARFAHPREEHLLPLLVCFGAAETAKYTAKNIFDQPLLGAKTSSFMWQPQ